ncbi:MAG: lytic murein transglycosylase [Deltaproteobacteria bacterium]|nr:lytic murein transglycosylase [Deltaproteobacteria bacterium]
MQFYSRVSNLCIICLLVFNIHFSVSAQEGNGYFDSLQERLIEDGFDEKWIKKIYKRRGVTFEAKTISRYFVHSEATLDYNQFSTDDSIARARKYMEKYKDELESTEKKYGVDKELITAIILVETRFGAYTGRSPILNTLSTMASLADLWVRSEFWEMNEIMSEKDRDRGEFEKRAYVKSQWAYPELKAFLEHVLQEGMDPVKIKGSMAGAMGLAQFMPTNIPVYARDGNGDGRIDLFHHSDSIASIANFLRHFGWRPGISKRKAEKVIYYYNHSDYYVDAVLKVFQILKG